MNRQPENKGLPLKRSYPKKAAFFFAMRKNRFGMEVNVIAKTDYENFQNKIGYHFQDVSYLKLALTHSSYAHELTRPKGGKPQFNERMEFLGDAVLELVSSEFIYRSHPAMAEGDMTKYRASIVCEPTLAACAREIGLDEYVILGKGEESTGGRKRDSIISDAMEAVIGAVYLDGGLASAKEFVHTFVLNDLENKKLFFDSKTILQEYAQSRGLDYEYRLLREEGPEHEKVFTAALYLEGEMIAEGSGTSKKHAQQHAAYNAMLKIRKG